MGQSPFFGLGPADKFPGDTASCSSRIKPSVPATTTLVNSHHLEIIVEDFGTVALGSRPS